MRKYDNALTEAVANSSIEQGELSLEEMDIIKQALKIAETEGKSFLTSLYELMEQYKNETQRDKSR